MQRYHHWYGISVTNLSEHKVSSLYPFIIIANNIGRQPLVGKIIMKDKLLELNQDPTNIRYDPAKELFEDIMTQNYSKMGNRWFGLPQTEDLVKGFLEWKKQKE